MKYMLLPAVLLLLAVPVSQATLRSVASHSDSSRELSSTRPGPQIYGRFQLHNPADLLE